MSDPTNDRRNLVFADSLLSATLVNNAHELDVDGIAINLSSDKVEIDGIVNAPIFPWRSTILRNGRILSAERLAILKIDNAENLGGVMLRNWQWFGDIFDGFPRQTPLYMSPIDTVGTVRLDPMQFTREATDATSEQDFDIKLKCWWAPGQTDCFIHNEHAFLEVHTQIFGEGRMQKFAEHRSDTLYEEVVMAPGLTHEAFCLVTGANQWTYPWHRYFAETESIWLAIELHPRENPTA